MRNPASRMTLLSFALVFILLTGAALAQNYSAPSTPVIGSANTVTANAPVPRPTTTPCMVPLFSNLDFADFNPKFFITHRRPIAPAPGLPW